MQSGQQCCRDYGMPPGMLDFLDDEHTQDVTSEPPSEVVPSDRGPEWDEKVTTLMIHNVPHRLDEQGFREVLDSLGFQGKYDFLHLPIAKGRKVNTGFAFVNFVQEDIALQCMAAFGRFRFPGSKRRSRATPARFQGRHANVQHLMHLRTDEDAGTGED